MNGEVRESVCSRSNAAMLIERGEWCWIAFTALFVQFELFALAPHSFVSDVLVSVVVWVFWCSLIQSLCS